jgi:hypothetical protein
MGQSVTRPDDMRHTRMQAYLGGSTGREPSSAGLSRLVLGCPPQSAQKRALKTLARQGMRPSLGTTLSSMHYRSVTKSFGQATP